MSDESTFPPPPPPPPPRHKGRASLLVVGGVILGFFPLLFSLVASIFVEDALNESTALGAIPWYTFFTLPIGGVIVMVGFTKGAGNMANRNR